MSMNRMSTATHVPCWDMFPVVVALLSQFSAAQIKALVTITVRTPDKKSSNVLAVSLKEFRFV